MHEKAECIMHEKAEFGSWSLHIENCLLEISM